MSCTTHGVIPIPFTSHEVKWDGDSYREIQDWQFSDEPFYLRQVGQMLRNDCAGGVRHLLTMPVQFNLIPHVNVLPRHSLMIGLRQSVEGELVGFGLIGLSELYSEYASDSAHFYVPLLSKKPGYSHVKGVAREVIRCLEGHASPMLRNSLYAKVAPKVFLDVYTENKGAIAAYDKCGFKVLNEFDPIPDLDQNGAPYYVMQKYIT